MEIASQKPPTLKIIKYLSFALILLCGINTHGINARAGDEAVPTEFKGNTPIQWSVKMADAQIARKGQSLNWNETGRKKWDYADNVFLQAIIQLGTQVKDPKYAKLADAVMSSFVQADGTIKTYKATDYTLDNINGGKTLLALYKISPNESYRLAAANLRKQLDTHPRTPEGGFWHKQVYPQQMWLDGIYMASPFLAQYGQVFNEPADFDEVAKQIKLISQHAYDPRTGLYYHGWDSAKAQPWANKETGLSPSFWSRAIGWYGMALVDALDFIPADHPAHEQLIDELKKYATGIQKWQDKSGLWWQVTDQGSREGNYLEATSSCMFVYTLARGINKGYLPHDYAPAAVKGFSGIVDQLIKPQTMTLTGCCSVAGLGPGNTRNGSFEYYVHEPVVENDMKGVGPFVMAGIELQQLIGGDAKAGQQR